MTHLVDGLTQHIGPQVVTMGFFRKVSQHFVTASPSYAMDLTWVINNLTTLFALQEQLPTYFHFSHKRN